MSISVLYTVHLENVSLYFQSWEEKSQQSLLHFTMETQVRIKKDFYKVHSDPKPGGRMCPIPLMHKCHVQIIQVAATPPQRGVKGGRTVCEVGEGVGGGRIGG